MRLSVLAVVVASLAAQPLSPQSQKRTVATRVSKVLIRGNRRIDGATIMGLISTRQGMRYSARQIDRDIHSLYATGHFRDVKAYTEEGSNGGRIVIFDVNEWPLISAFTIQGALPGDEKRAANEWKSKQTYVDVGGEYSPERAHQAAIVLQRFLAQRGKKNASVDIVIESLTVDRISLTLTIEHRK